MYAKGLRVEGTIYWQALKDDGISFVVIKGSDGEVDSEDVSRLIQEAYDNKMPAIIETSFDPTYYKHYGGVLEVDKNSDLHLRAALKGLESKTCYGYWISCVDPFDIPWNATALGQFVDRIRHELNNIPLNGPDFPIGIRMSQGWYDKAKNQEGISNLSWLYFKPEWIVTADWRYPLTDVMNPGTLGRDEWDFNEYADGKYIYNGTKEELYTLFDFGNGSVTPPTPPGEPLPEEKLDEVYFILKRLEHALNLFWYGWEEYE